MTSCNAARPAYTLLLMIVLQTYYGYVNSDCGSVAKIIDSPEGIIAVEVNSTITFTCRGNGSLIIWRINSTVAVSTTGIIVHDHQYADCIVKRNMTVYVSLERNNSKITCSVRRNGIVGESKPANLIVIGPPLPPDPMLNVVNVSSLRVSWTAPYSWPEYNILGYKIVVYTCRDGKSIRSADINGTDSEYIFLAERCMEFTIFLSAINSIGESEAAIITGGLSIDQYYMPLINVTVCFQSDGTSDIEITFPLPKMCHYRDINYTIILRNPTNIVLDTGPKQYSHADQHVALEPPLVHEVIQSRLEVNTAYSVSVMVSTPDGIFYGNETNGANIFFNTTFDPTGSHTMTDLETDTTFDPTGSHTMTDLETDTTFDPTGSHTMTDLETDTTFDPTGSHTMTDQELIAVVVGSAAAVIALLVTASTTAVIVVMCVHKHKQDNQDHSPEKVRSVMIPNPIYEGPLYETIPPQTFASLAANVESDSSQERESRYLETPILPARSGEVVVHNTGITSVTDPAGNDNYTLMSPVGAKMILKN